MKVSRRQTEQGNTQIGNITKSDRPSALENMGITCPRCSGRMEFEKFYGRNESFCGLRCLLCGNILDPVILLHRLSGDPQIPIPRHGPEIISLIRKYMAG